MVYAREVNGGQIVLANLLHKILKGKHIITLNATPIWEFVLCLVDG